MLICLSGINILKMHKASGALPDANSGLMRQGKRKPGRCLVLRPLCCPDLL